MSFNRRWRFSSPSLEIIGNNEDIMTEISLYLPVKSILRFRSVSKQWHSLLTHPHFFRRYASRKSANSLLFFKSPSGLESLNLKGNNHNLEVVDFGLLKNSCQGTLSLRKACNGLLLFEEIVGGAARRRRFYICNPSTRKYTELAVPDSIATPICLFLNLAFDPSKSPHYKVIFLWTNDFSHENYHITIYSSETRTCRTLGFTFNTCHMWLNSGEFLNGAIHWAYGPYKNAKSSILYFDINQESLRTFPKPPYSSPGDYFAIMYFGECRGHLHLILGQNSPRTRQHNFDVYELKEDYSSWFPKYKVDFEVIAVDFPEIISYTDKNSEKHYAYTFFLRVLEDEEKPTLVISFANQLLAYNLIDKTTKKLCDIPSRGGDPIDQHIVRSIWWYQTFHCIESLSGV